MERSFLEVKKTVEFVKVADGCDIDNIFQSSIVISIATSSFTKIWFIKRVDKG